MDGQVRCRLRTFAIIGLIAAPAVACGPFFPSNVLDSTDERMLSAPAADFVHELSLLRPEKMPSAKAVLPAEGDGTWDNSPWSATVLARQTADADVSDLQAFLRANPAVQSEHPDLVLRLKMFRSALQQLADDRETLDGLPQEQARPAAPLPDPALLAGLPAEFELYERGALAWHTQQVGQARDAWAHILRLPENQRRYRSVWAAYMLGRSHVESDPRRAGEYFSQARDLATKGFRDSTGVAAASLGWEARAWYLQKKYAPAMELYMQQLAAGDRRAAISLRDTARAAMQLPEEELAELAQSPLAQRVLVAIVLSEHGANPRYDAQPSKNGPQRLLNAIERSRAPVAAGGDRMAWLAYQGQNFDAATRWLKLAPADSGLALFIRAKLALRAGNTTAAADLLAQAAGHFPANEEWDLPVSADIPEDKSYRPRDDAMGELAVLQLGRSRYVEALDLLLNANWWEDAAYLAERVLSTDELKSYVDRQYPKDKRGKAVRPDIRYLLARRLVRVGQWKAARDYMPAEILPKLDAYVSAIRDGRDSSRSKAQRAESLWQAARIARHDGLELMGCELYPDYTEYAGEYDQGDPRNGRAKIGQGSRLNAASADELARAQKTLPDPVKRFHYRYIAADHAWAAAELLPDGSEQTAGILNEAGSWIAARDAKAADRFYKALVQRCGKTELGKRAGQVHWFVSTGSARDGTGR